jgi:2-methylisocitrate lyase-like PEP mutase family enzyme
VTDLRVAIQEIDMSDDTDRYTRFRALHERDHAFVIPNPWDVGSARVLASMGFEALATTSAGHAFSSGVSDGAVPTARALEHCRAIVDSTPLPVSADLERGAGDDPDSVAETVRGAAAAGLAGCSIEDYTGDAEDPIFPFELAVERIEAAVEAARSLPHDFVLTARAENLLYGQHDLDDTIRRLQAFERAGADVLYAPALPDLDALGSVCRAVGKPVNALMPGARYSVAELEGAGARRISLGSALNRLAFGSLLRAGRELAEQGTFSAAGEAASFAELEGVFSGYPGG